METIQSHSLQTPAKIAGTKTGRTNFYLAASFLSLVFVLLGFTKTYVTPMMDGTFSGVPFVHLHGLLFFSWIILFIVQSFLMKGRKVSIHKKVGTFGFILAALMVVVGVSVAILSAKAGHAGGLGLSPKSFLLVPLSDMLLFSSFIVLSFLNLNQADTHKRLIVLATVAILPAAFGRIFSHTGITNPVVALLIMESLTIMGIVHDYISRKSIHKVYLWGGGVMLLVHMTRVPLSLSPLWISVAEWITG